MFWWGVRILLVEMFWCWGEGGGNEFTYLSHLCSITWPGASVFPSPASSFTEPSGLFVGGALLISFAGKYFKNIVNKKIMKNEMFNEK